MLKLVAPALLLLVMSGCAAGTAPIRQTASLSTPYVSDAHAHYFEKGRGSISGQGFLRQRGGGVVTCAGSKVLLMPATPFFKEAIEKMRAGYNMPQGVIPQPDRSFLDRTSQCDAQGGFRFVDLPEGSYIILTNVEWSVGYNRQGGVLMREIYVPEDGETSVMLSDGDYSGR